LFSHFQSLSGNRWENVNDHLEGSVRHGAGSRAPGCDSRAGYSARDSHKWWWSRWSSSWAASGLLDIIIDGQGALHESIDRVAFEVPIGSDPECQYFAFAYEAIDGLSGGPEQLGHLVSRY